MNRAYRFCRGLLWPLQKIFFRPKIYGRENIPRQGPYILCANHTSNIDPVIVACAVPVDLCFMAKAELFRFPPLGWILKKVGAFPVRRGEGDMGAFKQALTILKNGGVLAMFPEGTRVKEGEASRAKSGAAIFAIKANVSILPVAARGSKKLFTRNEVVIGKPFYLKPESEKPSREEFREQAEVMMNVIRELQKERF